VTGVALERNLGGMVESYNVRKEKTGRTQQEKGDEIEKKKPGGKKLSNQVISTRSSAEGSYKKCADQGTSS